MNTIDPINLAWFAGIFEADGHARQSINKDGSSHGCTINVTMINKEALDLMHSRLGVGKVYGPYSPTKAGNPTWKFQITDRKELARICLGIYPLLSEYKKKQISEVADYLHDHLPRPQNCVHCGEEYMPNSFRGAAKRSKYCSTKCNQRAWRQRRKEGS